MSETQPGGAMPPTPAETAAHDLAETIEETALGGSREFKTVKGDTILIEPWGLKTGKRMAARLTSMFDRMGAEALENDAASGLMEIAMSEIEAIVTDTLGWSEDEMDDRLTYVEFLQISRIVREVCMEGPLTEIAAFMSEWVNPTRAQAAMHKQPKRKAKGKRGTGKN